MTGNRTLHRELKPVPLVALDGVTEVAPFQPQFEEPLPVATFLR
jgi:hypothetical protein